MSQRLGSSKSRHYDAQGPEGTQEDEHLKRAG
jgi:hypothetical protein